MATISRVRAAAAVTAARATVLALAQVPIPPRSAAQWAFVRLYDALAENLLVSGRSDVAVTYRDLAILSSQRGTGKKTRPSSLRKPFSDNVWTGTLLEEPFAHDGLTLDIHLHPAGRRGRPLLLTASFKMDGKAIKIDDADPNGAQPVLDEVRSAEEREARLAQQGDIARRAVEDLRRAGFNSVRDLSRWFARRGIHIAPSLIIAILAIILCAATAGAVALIRYIVLHNTFRLTTNPDEQGSLPPGHQSRGVLVGMEQLQHGRFETRLAPGTIIYTFFSTDLQYNRTFPDSNLNFEWTITINGHTIKKTTTIPEIEYPYDGEDISVSVQPEEKRIYYGLFKLPSAGEHKIDKEEDRGWISGAACVLPRPGYAPERKSPIDAEVLPGRRVRFLIRHGPARAGDATLKFAFGDGTAWSSAERPWTISEAGGDAWDRYQTTLEHVYARPGHYDIRFALFRDVGKGKGLECLRQAIGQVYVDMPTPSTVPVAPRSPFPGYSVFVRPGTTSVEGGFTIQNDVPGAKAAFWLHMKRDHGRFSPSPQAEVVSVKNDPYSVVLGVVPPPSVIPWANYCAHVDFDAATSPSAAVVPAGVQKLGAQTMGKSATKEGTLLVGFAEFLQSGVYPITITAHPTSSRKEFVVVLRRKLYVSANAPPRVTE